jgi:hypothetical protein
VGIVWAVVLGMERPVLGIIGSSLASSDIPIAAVGHLLPEHR